MTPMMNRRQWLAGTAAVTGVALSAPVLAQTGEGAKLNRLLEVIFNERVDASPTMATSLGLDKGARAHLKYQLDSTSVERVEKSVAQLRSEVVRLKTINRDALTGMDRINYDSLFWGRELSLEVAEKYPFGARGAASPYLISQLTGYYQAVPDFIVTQHTIESRADIDAYMSRIEAFAECLNHETERFKDEAARGIVAPNFALAKAASQLEATIKGFQQPDYRLKTNLLQKAAAKGFDGEWAQQMDVRIAEVVKALQAQHEAVTTAQATARSDGGVWALPKEAEGYYAYAARIGTTTRLTSDEIHKTGLDMVAELSAEADARLKAIGYTQGTVGERIAALGNDEAYIYPNTDEAKAELLSDLNVQIKAIEAKLPDWFGILPKSSCDVRRVPVETEAGAPGGYYIRPSLDGSRPGAYYINLRDTKEWPKWSLPTLTYHEAIPGHHLQIALQMEAEALPDLRKTSIYSAYSEGWALYAEKLADEMGMYEGDAAVGYIGYLQSALFRAIRLVVDTGLHDKRWSREQAIEYFVATNGDQVSAATTEVERYCVWPGQALSYMVGKIKWMDLRDRMMAKQGAGFDIKQFHDTGLQAGAVPLDVLERVYAEKGLI